MERYQRRIGLILILVAVANCTLELAAFHFLFSAKFQFFFYVQSLPGILIKNLLCFIAGAIALFVRGKNEFCFRAAVLILCLDVLVILLTTPGSIGHKFDAFINFTSIPLIALLYTLAMTKKEEMQWNEVGKNTPAVFDLKLKRPEDWFNPYQAGPRFVIDDGYVSVLERFIASMKPSAPLVINLLCAEPVSEMMQDTMKETLRMYYEEEEDRVRYSMEKRYRRILITLTVSVILIVLWKLMNVYFEDLVYWEIIGNIAAFGLWQVGYLLVNQNDQFEELLRVHIGKRAEIHFI